MADKNLLQLPLATTAAGALIYGIQDNADKAFPASVLQGSEQPQGNNLVYAGPPTAPGGFPTFRPLVIADIPDLSTLYLASNGGTLVGATINNSTIVGGTISGATAIWDDDKFSVRNVTDTTKIIRFSASTISAGQTRIFSWPDLNGQVVTDNASQNLTNKSVFLRASASGAATFRIPHGVPPSAPVNGDMWTTNAGLFVQANNVTIGPLAASASSTVTTFNGRQGAVTLTTGDVTTAIGFTPVNKAGDTMTGNLTSTGFIDGVGNLRAGINTAIANAANADANANQRVLKAGDVMTGPLRVIGSIYASGSVGDYSALDAGGTTYVPVRFRSTFYDFKSPPGTDYSLWASDINGNWTARGGITMSGSAASSSDSATAIRIREFGATGEARRMDVFVNGPTNDPANQVVEFRSILVGGVRFNTPALHCTGAITAAGGFGPGSDPKLKETSSLRSVDNALDKVYNLNVKYGKYHDWYNPDGKERVFLMADEALRENVPQAVLTDAIEKDGTKYNGWSADQMIALLVKAVQELTDEVRELKENKNAE